MTPFIQRALVNSLRKVSADLFFEVLNNELAKNYSIRLFTLTEIDHLGGQAKRIYSSAPKQYPIGGYKQIETNDWSKQVLEQGEAFIANTEKALSEVFFDHQLISSMGLGAVINWPVIVEGKVVGTVNILSSENSYLDCDLEQFEALYSWFVIAFLLPVLRESSL
ncbi:GAF domain-containing protein [Shewanella woodyi]|uniref:GAF domain-containing protein n=1 Tax=Shewanella woodyi TaxID=60961 RepID=UPI003748569C